MDILNNSFRICQLPSILYIYIGYEKENKFNHIELFSGCGGLSLGLEKAGFELLLANELSPMAAETFSYNFLMKITKISLKR